MPEIEIISLPPNQWQLYKAIRLEALRTEPQAFGSNYPTNLAHPDSFWQGRLEEAAKAQNQWLLFARVDGRIVGIIGAFRDDDPAVVHIISVYVNKDYRGKGISKALMTAILAAVQQIPTIRTARLTVMVDQAPAVGLYQSVGFQIVGRETVRMGDGLDHDEYLMERALNP